MATTNTKSAPNVSPLLSEPNKLSGSAATAAAIVNNMTDKNPFEYIRGLINEQDEKRLKENQAMAANRLSSLQALTLQEALDKSNREQALKDEERNILEELANNGVSLYTYGDVAPKDLESVRNKLINNGVSAMGVDNALTSMRKTYHDSNIIRDKEGNVIGYRNINNNNNTNNASSITNSSKAGANNKNNIAIKQTESPINNYFMDEVNNALTTSSLENQSFYTDQDGNIVILSNIDPTMDFSQAFGKNNNFSDQIKSNIGKTSLIDRNKVKSVYDFKLGKEFHSDYGGKVTGAQVKNTIDTNISKLQDIFYKEVKDNPVFNKDFKPSEMGKDFHILMNMVAAQPELIERMALDPSLREGIIYYMIEAGKTGNITGSRKDFLADYGKKVGGGAQEAIDSFLNSAVSASKIFDNKYKGYQNLQRYAPTNDMGFGIVQLPQDVLEDTANHFQENVTKMKGPLSSVKAKSLIVKPDDTTNSNTTNSNVTNSNTTNSNTTNSNVTNIREHVPTNLDGYSKQDIEFMEKVKEENAYKRNKDYITRNPLNPFRILGSKYNENKGETPEDISRIRDISKEILQNEDLDSVETDVLKSKIAYSNLYMNQYNQDKNNAITPKEFTLENVERLIKTKEGIRKLGGNLPESPFVDYIIKYNSLKEDSPEKELMYNKLVDFIKTNPQEASKIINITEDLSNTIKLAFRDEIIKRNTITADSNAYAPHIYTPHIISAPSIFSHFLARFNKNSNINNKPQ